MTDKANSPARSIYVGIFLIALSTLTLQILLTRIFNVTMMYHFAFVAISITMFGMTAGAITVFLRPGLFDGRVPQRLSQCALITGISAVIATTIHWYLLKLDPPLDMSILMIVTVSMFIVPFLASGICVTLVLTRYTNKIGSLYAADLAGAALGCVAVIGVMEVAGALGGVVAVAITTSAAAYAFATAGAHARQRNYAVVAGAVMAVALVATTVKNFDDAVVKDPTGRIGAIYEKWTALSRIFVQKYDDVPFGWGFSHRAPLNLYHPQQLHLSMDANAGTVLTQFNGDRKSVDYLRYDVTNISHYVRPNSNVLVIGVGGGRDVLSALVFGQKSVLGIEMNRVILDVLTRQVADFTGNLQREPNVKLVNDEARSYIARLKDRFDIIQISLIDTWAATAAGAFVFSENTLYTREAWTTFLSRLNPTGVLSVSRWYFEQNPAETYRLTSLATETLKGMGVSDPRRHIVAMRSLTSFDPSLGLRPDGVVTMLVSPTPFTDEDIVWIRKLKSSLGFEIVLMPEYAKDNTLSTIADGRADADFYRSLPVNVVAPTDDNPFFFNMLRLNDILDSNRWELGNNSFNMKAVTLLGTVFFIALFMTLLCIAIPWITLPDKSILRQNSTHLVFFAAIGLGFLMIEIAQMQRLMVFLGHPLYGLSVILFALLLGGGTGSYLSHVIAAKTGQAKTVYLFLAILAVVSLIGVLTYPMIQEFRGAATPARISIALALILPLGLVMGMAFPLGMTVANATTPALTPWLWGMNGAMSVLASVGAVLISLASGIATTYWVGATCYVVAALAYYLMLQKRQPAGVLATAPA